ncbi:DNA polymerase III subunit beta [Ruminiclostridium cellobioparum]|uniref:Beta sliding clamp n=1 Tax=Ruminiclostridium cellobioparum subsp. termitidis CT1112 TaxID=1195236 RepID=S0FNQ4_RUMCE|nr:DNA polymerase III subunit beta [Ruminiclostridium cellobioparum]EMS73835.1 DNA polymerase III, beta subunit [Ruminiclostridium cellobioparum subsp. termitidis CT1112]
MKIICSKENLLNGINIVQKAVSTKTTLPILEGILLNADEKFKLTGNDLEIGIECFVEADIRETGSIVINSKIFGDIVRRLPDSEVLIEVKENNLVIVECENSHFEIKGINPNGYPALPNVDKENVLTLTQGKLKDMIRQTVFAVGTDENRPVLTGSLIEVKDKELVVVSIDGFRLALRRKILEGDVNDFSVIVPGKTLNEISKILQAGEEEVYIYNSNNQIVFDAQSWRIVSRLIEGKFLNYNSLLNKEFETRVIINIKEFQSSLERASLISMNDKNSPVKLSIGNDRIVITSNAELGAVREEIKVDIEGNNLEIGYNPTFLIDALKAIDEDRAAIYFITTNAPCTLRPVVENNNDFAYLVQAVRI